MGIYVDQIGFQTNSKKVAMTTKPGLYELCSIKDNKINPIKDIKALPFGYDAPSGENISKLDFTGINEAGKYVIRAKTNPQDETSVSFIIEDKPYAGVLKDVSKALYFQRCGCELESKYAGVYTHKACHTGKSIMLNDYLNKTPNPQEYDLQGGWHDAGDYGRYSTAAAVALGHILYAYELFPESLNYDLNIPETGNGVPDILNECRYELDWLIKMQAPDGGVYHKLTAFSHADFIMPEEDKDQFIIYPVSSMAVADYVAIMCVASRVYEKYDSDFAGKALEAAKKSFDWLEANAYCGFKNPEGSNTGEYGDISDKDERLWAAAEMLRTDINGNINKYKAIIQSSIESGMDISDFGWTDVAGFALLSILTDPDNRAGAKIKEILCNKLISKADSYLSLAAKSGYDLFMEEADYVWGSNMVVLNRGILMSLAYMYAANDKKNDYLYAVESSIHYILGRNALDRSYVTGNGLKAYKNPHNRPTAADGIEDPMPGWVSGGPFKTPVDEAAKAIIPVGTPPMKCHADDVGSYSTNEITIYWNSPAIFVLAFLSQIN